MSLTRAFFHSPLQLILYHSTRGTGKGFEMAKGLRKLGSRQPVWNFMESQEPCETAILKEEYLFSYKTVSLHLNLLCFVLVAV